MSQVQLGLSFFRPSAISASEEAANHPAANLLTFTKWARTAQSTTTTTGWTVIFDFGVAVAPPGFFLNNLNFGLLKAAVSTTGVGSWVELYSGSGIGTLTDDRVSPRRKAWFPSSGWATTWNHRYLRLQGFSLDASETAFSLGAAAFPSPVANMVRNWAPPDFIPKEPITRLAYAGGGGEGNVEGRTLMAFDLQYGPNFKDGLAQLHTLRALGQDVPLFLYENRGDLSHAYILKRVAEVRFGEQFAALTAGPWTFEECV